MLRNCLLCYEPQVHVVGRIPFRIFIHAITSDIVTRGKEFRPDEARRIGKTSFMYCRH